MDESENDIRYEPGDELLADVLGLLAVAMEHFEEARPLMAQKHTHEAYKAVREYARRDDRGGGPGV